MKCITRRRWPTRSVVPTGLVEARVAIVDWGEHVPGRQGEIHVWPSPTWARLHPSLRKGPRDAWNVPARRSNTKVVRSVRSSVQADEQTFLGYHPIASSMVHLLRRPILEFWEGCRTCCKYDLMGGEPSDSRSIETVGHPTRRRSQSN